MHGSDRKVWWMCDKGHEWEATISSRTSGRGCPICSKELQSSLPEKACFFYLKRYFDDACENYRSKSIGNRELDIYIPSLKVGIEYDGYEWHKDSERDLEKDKICYSNGITLFRLREKKCPIYESNCNFIYCERIHSNIELLKGPIFDLFEKINDIFGTAIEPDINIERDLSAIYEMFVSFQKENSLSTMSPNLLSEWNYKKNGKITPEMVSNGSNKKVWWKCSKGHEWQASIASRSRDNSCGCPICANHKVMYGYNDLESLYPEVAKEWDYKKNGNLSPKNISATTNRKVWWKCSKGHSWQANVYTRTKMGTNCPICKGKMPVSNKNDLKTLFPDIAKEWDYEKNGSLKPEMILPGSERKIWWICPKGHSYQTLPRIRTQNHSGCPICKNLKTLTGYNDLATLHPELVKEWDYSKNVGLSPYTTNGGGGSHKKVWWKCKNGHSWQAALSSRIRLKTGCPICDDESRKKK